MELKSRLREQRTAHGMTQEAVAAALGVSSQSVSKWERGLLSPDISLLPRIARLFDCSIDFLFGMELTWDVEHRRDFEEKLCALHKKRDYVGVYLAWLREIELNPDHYENYPDVMLHVLRRRFFDKEHVLKMISLADHAEKCCTNDDIRNEIFRLMLQICASQTDQSIKEKGMYYYKKLPMLRHSREVYARFATEGETYRAQLRKNIAYLIDLTECSVRELVLPEMPPEEKLFYYEAAASLYEALTDGRYAGFYDPPLLSDYFEIAGLYSLLGDSERAREYLLRAEKLLLRHMTDKKGTPSPLLPATAPANMPSPEKLCRAAIERARKNEALGAFADILEAMSASYEAYFIKEEDPV